MTPGAAIASPYWSWSPEGACAAADSSEAGLTERQAADRRAAQGPNAVAPDQRRTTLRLLIGQFANPIILILLAATVLSMIVGDPVDGSVILVIICASGGIGFWQEHRASQAVAALARRVHVQVEVMRDRTEVSIPVDAVVPGDVVLLRAGDIIPADGRLLACSNLLVDEAALTGESYPAQKALGPVDADAALGERTSAVFAGTFVASGTGSFIVQATGRRTLIGSISADLAKADVTTRFEQGATSFGRMLVWVMLALVSAVLVINIALQRPVVESALFSLALAVGITPQLLPAIVAVSLAAGARRMAAQRVLTKRLDALEDFGSMTLLACDKTGTLTQGSVTLDAAYDLRGHASAEVLRCAVLNASLQRGFANPIDTALTAVGSPGRASSLAEVPYDFQRKRLSILVRDGESPLLITKGAFEQVLITCSRARVGSVDVPLEQARPFVTRHFADLVGRGFRVLAVAVRSMPGRVDAVVDDETDMTLIGLLAFHDPVKQTAASAIADLASLGVRVVVMTGDHRLAALAAARQVGLRSDDALTGDDVRRLDDVQLAERLRTCNVCAEVEPLQKERLVRVLQAGGESVGLLGDGINDAPALKVADVGISVDSAVDVARQAAAIVLLDKDLGVVAEGIRLGRATFANTLKYVRVTISANFGNVLSMAVASAFLPFLPLLPLQILLLNFMSDIPALTISEDAVDPEDLARPRSWDIRAIVRFMVVFGLVSSAFDLMTFAVLRLGFAASAELFRSSWFIESTGTELVAMLVLRTTRHFWRSRPGSALLWSSIAVAAVTVLLPYSPLAGALGLSGLPIVVLAIVAAMILGYVAANEAIKSIPRARRRRDGPIGRRSAAPAAHWP